MSQDCDVLVIGAGNAAMCAALAAREQGARVTIVERASKDESGGNSRFTAGAMRVAYRGVDDLKVLMPDLTDDEIALSDFGTYTTDQFFDDMFRVTRFRTDPELCERLVMRSFETLHWMQTKGVKFAPIWGRQAFKIAGKFKFWGGLTIEVWGGGPGLVEQETMIAERSGITIKYDTRLVSLLYDGHAVLGARVKANNELVDLKAPSVVLCCGGFEFEHRMANSLSGAGLGTGESSRHEVQHR